MKKISVRNNKYALVDDKDYDYLTKWKWQLSNSGYPCRAQSTGKKYLLNNRIRYKYKTLYMHRVIMGEVSNEIDHINGNKLDNRRANLRLSNHFTNSFNKGPISTNTSGYKGVTLDRRGKVKKWCAQVHVNGKHISLGYYASAREAAKAYDNRIHEYHGKFARLNNAA